MAEFGSKKRGRGDSDDSVESRFDSPEVKRLREDLLLESFDDGELYTGSSELDSFMKSFEEEILSGKPPAGTSAAPPLVVDLTSESGESQPDLGYLLEASDDELGLPPSTSQEKTELVRVESDSTGLSGDFWGYSEDLPNFDSFDAGIIEFGDYMNNGGGGGEYVALDGLFDYSDLGFGSNDIMWRPETLHAK